MIKVELPALDIDGNETGESIILFRPAEHSRLVELWHVTPADGPRTRIAILERAELEKAVVML